MQLKTKPKGSTDRVGVIESHDNRKLKYRTIWRENGKQCSKGFENYDEAVKFREEIEKELIDDYLNDLIKIKPNEEYKAIEWLNTKRKDYTLSSEDLHYLNIIYYLLKKEIK